ncbi:MAG: hypothetical protein GY788_24370 [bacterium]|nr:hypothetical protein [bacterium]
MGTDTHFVIGHGAKPRGTRKESSSSPDPPTSTKPRVATGFLALAVLGSVGPPEIGFVGVWQSPSSPDPACWLVRDGRPCASRFQRRTRHERERPNGAPGVAPSFAFHRTRKVAEYPMGVPGYPTMAARLP